MVTSPPVPCANCGGGGDDDDDDLDAGARIAIALAAVFCFLGGVLATMLYISRMNKFNGCLSSANGGSASPLGGPRAPPVDPTHKDEVRPAGVVLGRAGVYYGHSGSPVYVGRPRWERGTCWWRGGRSLARKEP